MRLILISGILLSLYQGTLAAEENIKRDRDGKLLSLFNIVTFPNDPCEADTKNGTCYTAEECSQKAGTNDGSCASGYGVCCTFTPGCGDTVSENNTYFESSGSEVGSCTVKICPCSDNICQLRLDFETFTLTGPSTVETAECLSVAGNCVTGTGTYSSASQCATDLFSVTNPGGLTPPAICGTNSGEHMYVDSSTACNDLNLLLGTSAVGTTLATRSWSIRVTQLECTSDNLAPAGCTQYFFGDDSGTVKTYNYAGNNYHLANQNQVQCIRREKGNCKICYAAVAATDFAVSGAAANQMFDIVDCCSYGAEGAGVGYDCVIIDGLSTSAGKPLSFQNFCGAGGLATAAGAVAAATAQKTLCTKRQPFKLQFQSDNWEMIVMEVQRTNPQIGYNLAYTMSSNGC